MKKYCEKMSKTFVSRFPKLYLVLIRKPSIYKEFGKIRYYFKRYLSVFTAVLVKIGADFVEKQPKV